MRCRILMMPALLFLLSASVLAEQRFPPPEFESGHELPTTSTPVAPGTWLEYRDAAVLVVALSLASWLTLKQRGRRWIFLLAIFSLVYFGFYRNGCVCAIGSIQNVTLAAADSGYALPLSVLAFFVLPLLFALFFGRGFCAAVCPLGAIQEVVLVKPVQVPEWVEQGLSLLAYVYLGVAVLFAAHGAGFLICRYDPFVAFFRLDGPLNIVTFGVLLLVVGAFIGRPYCRFLCPYGVLLRLMARFSRWRVSITPSECTRCHLCTDSCPYGALRRPQQAPPAAQLGQGRRRLAVAILLLPVLIITGGLLGFALSDSFARMHPIVQQADAVAIESNMALSQTTDEVIAFRTTGQPVDHLYLEASAIQGRFRQSTWLLGAFVGLVVGVKLIRAAIFRSRFDYLADSGRCLACGRCFAYCPVEQERLLKIRNLS